MSSSSNSSRSSKSILIIGGGTFGTSAAYHLSQRGYKSVRVLDRWPIPSIEAAGNDLNKVVRADYAEPLYSRLGSEAMACWKDDNGIFKKYFNPTGWLLGAANVSLPFIDKSIENSKALGVNLEYMPHDEIRKRWPRVSGKMSGWKVLWNSAAGWVDARGALTAMAQAAIRNGVEYISGDAGYVTTLLFDNDKNCIGVQTADGKKYMADEIIIAAGASAGSLLDFHGQLVAKGHTVGHLQLTAAEAEYYKGLPLVDQLEQGMMFPPTPDGIVKFAAVEFFTNKGKHSSIPGLSLPRYRSDHPQDTIPAAYERKIRNFVKELVPELANRPWVETRICWDADTPDLHFLIAPHPLHRGLKLAVGGSAHGFKFLPVIGKYIVDMMEGTLDARMGQAWRWRPGVTSAKAGPEPHPFKSLDLEELTGWNSEGNAGKSGRQSKL
ncbi:putative fructosyl amino acid oxidase [Coleophoma cylindrospora]|uniref:Putative fructosyl amino acid oxidase n=1 Tax=Coleophoma cylindrospora TaxID=1849047 RepID=A0A3D8RU60_9HELO|nr:putative fructosyl amino acid oxidase [Coleophoma cylindrospora]